MLILRHREAARETAMLATGRGHQPMLLPLQEIVPLAAPPPDGPFGGFVVTSGNAVPALARAFPHDARPVLAVGARTGALLGEAGFRSVLSGGESGDSLAGPAEAIANASALPLLYAAGRVRTPALETALARRGVRLAVWEVYDTRPLTPAPADLDAAFCAGPPDVVLLLSVGQAAAYQRLLEQHPQRFRPAPRLLCLSARIFAALPVELRAFAEISGSARLAALFDPVP